MVMKLGQQLPRTKSFLARSLIANLTLNVGSVKDVQILPATAQIHTAIKVRTSRNAAPEGVGSVAFFFLQVLGGSIPMM